MRQQWGNILQVFRLFLVTAFYTKYDHSIATVQYSRILSTYSRERVSVNETEILGTTKMTKHEIMTFFECFY